MPGHVIMSGGGSVAIGSVTGLGTGVATALAVNVGSAGAPVVLNGALGTPSSGTLTNATGLPVATGISGLGTGVGTFLATPSSANLASALTDELGSGKAWFGPDEPIADLASANDITLPATGRVFRITGTTQINTVTAPGSGTREVVFIFTDALTFAHNAAGTGASFILPSAANFNATDDDVVKMVYEASDAKWLAFARQAL